MNSTFEPLLNIGIIFELFMLFGKIPLSKDILNIAVSGLVIYCMVFLRIAILMPLLSVEVLLLHVLTMPTTSSSVTGLKNMLCVFFLSR